MTAKFDAKRARENMWVTHQNLARAKGGRPHYQFQERKLPRVQKAPAPAPAAPAVPATTKPSSDE